MYEWLYGYNLRTHRLILISRLYYKIAWTFIKNAVGLLYVSSMLKTIFDATLMPLSHIAGLALHTRNGWPFSKSVIVRIMVFL